MRELSEKEMGAIAGGYLPSLPPREFVWVPPPRPAWVIERHFQQKPSKPLATTFGGPTLILPGDPPGEYF